MISNDNDEWRCGIDSSCCISLFPLIKTGRCDAGGKDFGGYGYCDTLSLGGWVLPGGVPTCRDCRDRPEDAVELAEAGRTGEERVVPGIVRSAGAS